MSEYFYVNDPVPHAKKRRSLFFFLGVSGIIIAMTVTYLFFQSRKREKGSELFIRAEQLYAEQQFTTALSVYRDFLKSDPDGASVSLVNRRINDIQLRLESIGVQQLNRKGISDSLFQKALSSYRARKYLKPSEDNAIYYLNQIPVLDSVNSAADQLRKLIVQAYEAQAEQAVDKKQFDSAVENYKNILRIYPESPPYQIRLEEVVALGNQHSAELAKLKKQTASKSSRSKKSVTRRKRTASKPPSRTKSSQKPTTPKRTAQRQNTNIRNSQQTTTSELKNENADRTSKRLSASNERSKSSPAKAIPETKPGISTSTSNLNSNNKATKTAEQLKAGSEKKAAPVNIALIDGGKRVYLHREELKIPRSMDYGGFSLMKAECIVGLDGSVEEVKILVPSSDRRLTKLVVETLKKNRYLPGKYRGKPVRYKVVENVDFVKFRRK